MPDEVSIKKSNGYLRNEMNLKLESNLADLFQAYKDYLAKNVQQYKDMSQIQLNALDQTINSALNSYLSRGKLDQASSILAEMGGSLFQNLRICRDLIYTQKSREDRIIAGLRGQLIKAKANKDRGYAFI